MTAEQIPKKLGANGLGLAYGQGPTDLKKLFFKVYDLIAATLARSDASMQAKVDAIATQLTAVRTAHDALVGKYNAHLASSGSHVAADVDNVIAAPAATDPTADILALVNDAYDMAIAHFAEGAAVHPGGADAVNTIDTTAPAAYPATTEVEAYTLMNRIKAAYEAHRANTGGAFHTNPDVTNTITEADATDWDSLVTLANAYKGTTGFNAHVILTAGPTHGATDVAHVITAADSGVQITALFLEINECQTDYNAHVADLGVHPNAGTADATAAATTEATAVALLNALGAALNVHMDSADDHLDADATTTQWSVAATEYEDIVAAVLDYRTAYAAHRVQGPALHLKVDATNTGSLVGAGGDVAVLGTGSAVAITDYLTKES